MISHLQALSHCSNLFGLTSCITLYEEEERTFAFTQNSHLQSELTRLDENMSTRSRKNSTKTTGKTIIRLILLGMEECTKK